MQAAVLIVNPFASRVTPERIGAVEAELRRVSDLRIVLTERPGHATELARAAAEDGVDAIVVYSGDGGFNETLNGLDRDIPVGFLPGGGTSVLSRALGLPAEPAAAARRVAYALERGSKRRITLGRVNGRRFAFGAGVGLDADVVRRVDRLGRRPDGRRPGDLAFAWEVMRALAAARGHLEPQLEVKGFGRAAFAIVANGSPYTYAKRMPLPVAPEAQFELGLDLVAPVRLRRRSLLPAATVLLLGGARRSRTALYGHDLDRLEIDCDRPMPLQADGEDLGDVDSVVFEAERGAVTVLV